VTLVIRRLLFQHYTVRRLGCASQRRLGFRRSLVRIQSPRCVKKTFIETMNVPVLQPILTPGMFLERERVAGRLRE
jgi:hypothetical protein